MDNPGAHERLYRRLRNLRVRQGLTPLGLHANWDWHVDPKRLVITLARYKFIARMLAGKRHVLEIGCGDAFGSRLILQEVDRLTAIDIDPVFIEDVRERMEKKWGFEHRLHDILERPVEGSFDAAYCLDLLPHFPAELERRFMLNVCDSLTEQAVLILGMPSIQAHQYCSEESKNCHVNRKTHDELRELMLRYFHHCFLFSANDELVHTGFYPMAHGLLALGVGKRRDPPLN